MKKSFLIVAAAVVVLTVVSGCAKKQESAKPADVPKKVIIGVQQGVIPNAIALAEGWLTEALGTEVDVVYFDAGRDVIAAMASGSIDIGQVGAPPAALAATRGIPCQVFYVQGIIGEAVSLIVRGNLGITGAQGLIGRKIAVTFSSTAHYDLMNYLKINNVKPSDVDIIDMNTSDILEAFMQGKIDGAYTWDPNLTQMKNNGGVMLTNSREMADRGYASMDVDIVRTEFAERYPDVVGAYVRTMDRAVALYRNDPKAAGAAMARFTGLTAEECLAQAESSIWLTVDEQKGMRWAGSSALSNIMYSTALFLYDQGNISTEPSIELFQKAVTNRYLVAWGGGGGVTNYARINEPLSASLNWAKVA